MHLIYLDNFRGFQNSVIPLLDVNFLVGENSSGKTSFLSLLNVFASPHFWFAKRADSGDFSFGHFGDIVSINSKKRDYFRIGFVETSSGSRFQQNEDDDHGVQAFLFTYKMSDGMPRLYKCTSNFLDREITIIFTEKTTRYSVKEREFSLTVDNFRSGLFTEWGDDHDQSHQSGYKVIDDDFLLSEGAPSLLAFDFIYGKLSEELGSKQRRRFSFIHRPSFGGELTWIAPIRTKPRRTYDEVRLDFSPEGEHTPYLVKKILDGGASSDKFLRFLRRFGQESGLFKEVNVHRFGQSVTSPFELEITLESRPLNISNVGYGVSQALPVVVELFIRPANTWFAIQQPEVHLHPRAQAAIGEMIFQVAEVEKKRFFVETHSDFTVDRYRITMRDNDPTHSSQILFFERKNGTNCATALPLDRDGNLAEPQPKNYRSFFLREELRILGAK